MVGWLIELGAWGVFAGFTVVIIRGAIREERERREG